jgi:hypothetical protein
MVLVLLVIYIRVMPFIQALKSPRKRQFTRAFGHHSGTKKPQNAGILGLF